MNNLFVIEDDFKIRTELCEFLSRYGYECSYSEDFKNIIGLALNSNANLILLDINLPFYDGFYILSEIRKKSEVPVIIITSRQSEIDELRGMNLGCDDFVTKPFNTEILLARIGAVLKRSYKNYSESNFVYKDLIFSLDKGMISYNNKSCELTKNESRILLTLMNKKESIVPRNDLMDALWQCDEFIDDNTLTVNVNRLRKKLEGIGACDMLKTKRGQGYILMK
ncbi:MAG: response regulator transcription factor [Clostridium sp.]|uniref:response regulator transcription factor n=1 Tax=Clostridium sp. DSM 8431 TaxID=1761781 RepID=UPI0008EF8D67|nr:response regulator transcription factor [Clostridium sp. DSM 8431]MCR4944428.1 response regulator transcription factor [Clostridium sp.]SFU79337.1 DNA-binding response regulator, OmpR family, contains REC and winged-helix (wHTH) domain [Clostridium sp. DSM 8431]